MSANNFWLIPTYLPLQQRYNIEGGLNQIIAITWKVKGAFSESLRIAQFTAAIAPTRGEIMSWKG